MAFPLRPCVNHRGHSSQRRALLPLLLVAFAALALLHPAVATKRRVLSFGMKRSGSDSSALVHANHKRQSNNSISTKPSTRYQ